MGIPVWSVSDTARIVFKIAVFVTFLAALTYFSIWFLGFMTDIYNIIHNSASSLSSSNIPSSLSCLLSILGIDVFLTSAFSIFFSAVTFWVTAVGYILSYKLGLKAYDGIFKVAT